MKYFEDNGKKIVENGRTKVRVELHTLKPSPFFPKERTVKVFEVVEVFNTHPDNPLERGNYLALSFPNNKLNAKGHDWTGEKRQNGGWVECQVPFTISDRRAALLTMKGDKKAEYKLD